MYQAVLFLHIRSVANNYPFLPALALSVSVKSCLELIIENKIKKVVFAASEPKDFVDCEGEKVLKNAGVKVTKFEKLEKKALDVNRHILL